MRQKANFIPQSSVMCCSSLRPRHAFTLIELLVSIGVIAVLVAILLPALGAAKKSAARASCIANLHGLGGAISLYRGAHDGLYPDADPYPDLYSGTQELIDALEAYSDAPMPRVGSDGTIETDAPWRCPSDPSVAATFGMSYEYEIATLVMVYEVDGYKNPLARVSLLTDEQADLPILTDAPPNTRSTTGHPDPWHKGPNGSGRNALFADGSAGWLP